MQDNVITDKAAADKAAADKAAADKAAADKAAADKAAADKAAAESRKNTYTNPNRKCSTPIGKNETCDLYPADHTWTVPEGDATADERNAAQEVRGAPHRQREYLDAKGHTVVGTCKGYTDDPDRKDDE